jgi:hypothetical protein
MEGVDQPRTPMAGRRQGGQSPYRAGLGHMGVDEPCATVLEQPADDQKTTQVSGGPHWADQRDVPHRDLGIGDLTFSLPGAAGREDRREFRG